MKILMRQINKIRSFNLERHKSLLFIYFILGVISIFTISGLHGSSIGMWNKYLNNEKPIEENIIIGVPRAIRSDEWLVQTPLALSQYYNNYERVNKFVGYGEDTIVIYDAPNNHWSTLFKPHNLGFFFLPEENAFAFKWWFRGAILIISAYLLLLVLTRRNLLLSIAGSLILFFTPMIQWWYSVVILEPIAYGFLSLYFAIRILKYESFKMLLLYLIGFTYSLVSFTLAIYPPYQISVLYVVVFTFLGFSIENWDKVKENFKIKFFFVLIGLLFAIFILYGYYLSAKDTTNILLNTSYPGERFVSGGNYSMLQFLSGPYSFLLQLNSSSIPTFFGNQTEGSSFLTIVPFTLLMPFILYFVIKTIINKNRKGILLGTLSFLFLIFSSFIFIGFPKLLAKYSLFYLVPENRMIIGIGLTTFIGIIIFADKVLKGEFELKFDKAIIFATLTFAFVFVTLIGRELNLIAPQYIRNILVIIAISSAIATIIGLILVKSKVKYGFVFFVLFSVFSAGMVNPLYFGLSPLRNSELADELILFNKQNNPENKKWIVFDSMFLGNYLLAQGIPTLNGTHLYPQNKIWEQLDSEGKYKSNYNRYSHIIFQENEGDKVSFENPVPDTLVIKINPCNVFFKNENIIYLISPREMQDYPCLSLSKKQSKGLNIYELIY